MPDTSTLRPVDRPGGSDVRWPDFFLVGAPKCGTTSLYEYLKAHPQVWMPPKELHYFGSDLDWHTRFLPRENYHDHYRALPDGRLAGDASVFYMISKTAAAEIHAANPDARIIAAVRDPMTMIPSLHQQNLKTGSESRRKLAEAIGAEAERRAGRVDIARQNSGLLQQVFYSEIACYSEQLTRYFEVFGPDRVHVVEYGAFVRDIEGEYRRVLAFLGLDPEHRPDFRTHNARQMLRSRALWRIVKHPPGWARTAWRRALPRGCRSTVLHAASRLYLAPGRAPLSPGERGLIREMYADEVPKLEALLGLDLSHWLR